MVHRKSVTRLGTGRPWARLGLWAARVVIAAFALAQIIPASFAFAPGENGPGIVICDGHGGSLTTWEELTGEPSPYRTPSDTEEKTPCPACAASCRTAAAVPDAAAQINAPAPPRLAAARAGTRSAALIRAGTTRPPSHAPPLHSC